MKSKGIIASLAVVVVAIAAVYLYMDRAAKQEAEQQALSMQMAAVKGRQELMKSIGGNAKAISDLLKESKGTKAEAQAAALKIGELAGQIPEAFKVEASLSEMDAVGKNRSKPEIWLNWEGFVESAETLEAKSAALVTAFESGNGETVQAAFGDMGKNACGACHDDFRGPKVE